MRLVANRMRGASGSEADTETSPGILLASGLHCRRDAVRFDHRVLRVPPKTLTKAVNLGSQLFGTVNTETGKIDWKPDEVEWAKIAVGRHVRHARWRFCCGSGRGGTPNSIRPDKRQRPAAGRACVRPNGVITLTAAASPGGRSRGGFGRHHVLGAALELLHLLPQRRVAALHQFQFVLDLGAEPLQFRLLAGHQRPLPGHRHFHLPHLRLERLLVLAKLLALLVELRRSLFILAASCSQLVGPLLQFGPGLRHEPAAGPGPVRPWRSGPRSAGAGSSARRSAAASPDALVLLLGRGDTVARSRWPPGASASSR